MRVVHKSPRLKAVSWPRLDQRKQQRNKMRCGEKVTFAQLKSIFTSYQSKWQKKQTKKNNPESAMCHLNFKMCALFARGHHFNCKGWKCLPVKVNYLQRRVFLLWERQMLGCLTSAKWSGRGVAGSFRSVYWRLLTVCGHQLNPHVNICT